MSFLNGIYNRPILINLGFVLQRTISWREGVS